MADTTARALNRDPGFTERVFCLFFEIHTKIGFYANLKKLFFRKLNDGILMLTKDDLQIR